MKGMMKQIQGEATRESLRSMFRKSRGKVATALSGGENEIQMRVDTSSGMTKQIGHDEADRESTKQVGHDEANRESSRSMFGKIKGHGCHSSE
jgi:hypothetical protein